MGHLKKKEDRRSLATERRSSPQRAVAGQPRKADCMVLRTPKCHVGPLLAILLMGCALVWLDSREEGPWDLPTSARPIWVI